LSNWKGSTINTNKELLFFAVKPPFWNLYLTAVMFETTNGMQLNCIIDC